MTNTGTCRYPTVTRVRRTTYYNTPSIASPHKVRTVERRVYW